MNNINTKLVSACSVVFLSLGISVVPASAITFQEIQLMKQACSSQGMRLGYWPSKDRYDCYTPKEMGDEIMLADEGFAKKQDKKLGKNSVGDKLKSAFKADKELMQKLKDDDGMTTGDLELAMSF